jgi:hypothetical protein
MNSVEVQNRSRASLKCLSHKINPAPANLEGSIYYFSGFDSNLVWDYTQANSNLTLILPESF